MRRKLARWAVISAVCALIHAPAPAADQIPQPDGRINDFAGVISADYRARITALALELEEKTTAEIAVVTIDSIAPYDEKHYARMLFDAWKPGKKGKDNGVLVLLAVKDRLWRIETGYGVEGTLPDGVCGEIGRQYMVPAFKAGNYGEGLYYGAAAIAQRITDEQDVTLSSLDGALRSGGNKQAVPAAMYFFAFIFFFLWNLPWPFIIGFPVTMLFALAFFAQSPLLGALVIAGYAGALLVRFFSWKKLPPDKRKKFFGFQNYGGTINRGGWGGGRGGFGGGGFGGGGGGGGGAGGKF